jgi:hypothetical protein
MKQFTTPKSMLRFPVGTEYIIVQSCPLLVAGLDGLRQGDCFYPAGSDLGYLIRKRESTTQERRKTLLELIEEKRKINRQIENIGFDNAMAFASDWK